MSLMTFLGTVVYNGRQVRGKILGDQSQDRQRARLTVPQTLLVATDEVIPVASSSTLSR